MSDTDTKVEVKIGDLNLSYKTEYLVKLERLYLGDEKYQELLDTISNHKELYGEIHVLHKEAGDHYSDSIPDADVEDFIETALGAQIAELEWYEQYHDNGIDNFYAEGYKNKDGDKAYFYPAHQVHDWWEALESTFKDEFRLKEDALNAIMKDLRDYWL